MYICVYTFPSPLRKSQVFTIKDFPVAAIPIAQATPQQTRNSFIQRGNGPKITSKRRILFLPPARKHSSPIQFSPAFPPKNIGR